MEIFFAVVATGLIGLAFIAYRKWRQLQSLSQRATTGLDQLKSQLKSRHLIVSHLSDSLPSSFSKNLYLPQLREAREKAEYILQKIEPTSPVNTTMRDFANCEQEFVDWAERLIESVEADETVKKIQSVAGCLEGLVGVNHEISDIVSMYNATVIAYTNLVDSSLIGRLVPHRFGLLDLTPHNSSNLSRNQLKS